jgi:hypothetical protein
MRVSQSPLRRPPRWVLPWALVLLIWGVSGVWGQVQTGSILVKVRDPEGKPLPGVTVTVTSPVLVAGQAVGVTDANGVAQFPLLPPGVYAVKLEMSGFRTVTREGIRVAVAQTVLIDEAMTVAAGGEVTVVGRSPTVDVTSAKESVNITREVLQNVPGGRDIWNLLEYKTPGLVTDRIDVGGSESGLQAGFTSKGTVPAQNTQALNGVNVTDPEAIGFADFYYDYDSFEEVQISTAGHPVEVGTPGVYVNMVTRRGTDRLQGQVAGYYQGGKEGTLFGIKLNTQSSNVTDELRRQGIQETGFKFLQDATLQLGGPLIPSARQKLRFFTSGRIWRVHRFVPGFVDEQGNPVVESTDMPSVLFNLTYQVAPKHTLDAFYTRQWYDKPQRGASALNTPLSNWKEDDTFDIYQLAWNGSFGSNLFVDARVSYVDIFFPLYIKEEAKRRGLQSTTELTTGKVTGANTLQFIFNRHRLQSKVVLTYFLERWLGGRHEFHVGWDFSYNPNSYEGTAIDDVNLYTFNGEPAFVLLWNTPVNVKRNTQFNAVFASDTFLIGRWSLYVGARLENVRGWLPAQSSPAGNFAPARSFPEMDVIDWTNVSPRLGVIYDLTGDGKTALKLNLARYYYQISTGDTDPVNPNSLGGEFRVWVDRNGDKKFQKGEEGPLLFAFGGVLTSLAPDLKQPYTNEVVVGFDREVVEDLRVGLTFTYRQERRLLGIENVGVRWIPTTVQDPVTGNPITVYNQDPATIGQDRFVVRNAEELNQDYRGLDIVVEKRFSHRWQLLASLTLSRTTSNRVAPGSSFDIFGIGALAIDPNNLVNAKGQPYWDRPVIFKMSGSYLLPWNVSLAGNLRIQSGQPRNRLLTVEGLNQGPVTVFAVRPGEDRYDTVFTLDLRLSKIFRIPGGRSLELMVDGYNLTNSSVVLNAVELTGPNYGTPLQIIAPRIFRLGARFQF